MAHVAVVGGGAAGLSAALFTQKNGLETTVFDTDGTWLHKAHLFNYPGIGSQDGTAFLETLREQVDSFGVERRQGVEVTDVEHNGDEFTVSTDADGDGEAESMETSVENAYATGAMVRAEEWQAVISAGDGAAAALNILSKEKGEHFHDFDVPATAAEVFGTMADEA